MSQKQPSNSKLFTIDQFSVGDWICFTNSENKKCIGVINEITITNKDANTVLDFYSGIEIINYIDEDGIPGTIKLKDFDSNTLITGVNMVNLFNKHNPSTHIKSQASLKDFVLNLKEINFN